MTHSFPQRSNLVVDDPNPIYADRMTSTLSSRASCTPMLIDNPTTHHASDKPLSSEIQTLISISRPITLIWIIKPFCVNH